MLRWVAALLMLLGWFGCHAPEALASGCTSRAIELPSGVIKLVASCPGGQDAKRLAVKKRECLFGGQPVPCHNAQGSWYSPRQCYISPVMGKTPRSDPSWQGHKDGRLYYCRITGLNTGTPLILWLPSRNAPPDPELLARRAVSQMQLRPIGIGIVPEARADRIGLVGMPVWLWVSDPAPQTWGPISRSASTGGYTVRATAKVSRLAWSMGDGSTVRCTSKGTPYAARYGDAMSPNCGYRYQQQGTYPVAAVSEWLVRWTGMGESGTFAVTLRSQTRIQVGELQVTTVNEGR